MTAVFRQPPRVRNTSPFVFDSADGAVVESVRGLFRPGATASSIASVTSTTGPLNTVAAGIRSDQLVPGGYTAARSYDLEASGESIVLFHVSEEPGIAEFIPRPSQYTQELVVWAVHDEKVRNYLVPRDCPRVTYFADSGTLSEDSERFLGTSTAVVAIEASWWNRIRSSMLYCYHLPPETFECIDECAGYFVSREPVRPTRVDLIEDPIAAFLKRGVELRILPTLGPLRDAVVASTLQFSIIRMRNADAGHAGADRNV